MLQTLGAPTRANAETADARAPEFSVVIVDDHLCYAEMLAQALDSLPGMRCLATATSAEEGVRLAARLRPSVVMMDIRMPGSDGLAATRLRAERGAANDRELREAEAALLEARTLSQNAQLDTESARLNLQSLVGDTLPPGETALAALQPPAVQTPVSVAQAELQTRLAALPLAAVQRALLPVASASYSYNVSDYSSVSAAIDSSSLQPQVGFSYQDPARTLPESAVDGVLSLSLSANISLGSIDALAAAERQGVAAEASLRAAREGGTLQETALRAAYTKADRDAELERRTFQNAQTSYEENVTRQELGLAAPLETRTALIELLQADLERRTAELTELGALLDLYELYALPPSETLR